MSEPSDKIVLLEETATVSTREVITGKVRISTHVETVEELAHAVLHGETVDVTRVPIDRPVSGALPVTRTEGNLTIVPIFEEILVVEKRMMLKEELHIRRRSSTEEVSVPIQLRQQRADIERIES